MSFWIVFNPQPVELQDERSQQVLLLGDDEVLIVALHCCQCPVEGAGDEQSAVQHYKLVMHVHRALAVAHAYT